MLRDQDSEIVYRDFASSAMTQLARDLRQRETSAEDRLWSVLRNRRLARLKFRRQHPIAGTAYIVDFLCYAARLVVELDGGIHAEQVDDDDARQSVLEALGYKVIRFRNEDVFENLEVVLMTIMMAVQEMNEALLSDVALTPNPSPSGRGGQKQRPVDQSESGGQGARRKNSASIDSPVDTTPNSIGAIELSGSPLPEGEGPGVRANADTSQ